MIIGKSFKEITDQMIDLYSRKNSDYGDAFVESCNEFGLVSPVIRLNDKINRLKSLLKKDSQITSESIDDTLIDIANYAVMTLMWKSNDLSSK